MKPNITYVLIANGSRARILVNQGIGSGLKPALDHEFAASHVPNRELGTDRPGRTHQTGVGSSRHAMEPRTELKTQVKTRFIADLADVLDKAVETRACDQIVVAAPPEALGMLRAAIGNNTRHVIKAVIEKDLTHLKLSELPDALGKEVVL